MYRNSNKTLSPLIMGLIILTHCGPNQDHSQTNSVPCASVVNENGSYTITCPGSDPFTIYNGVDGVPGSQGEPGNQGEQGDPCTVMDNRDGTVTISCPDGTQVTYSVPLCGNGEVEAGEECDDANNDNTDDCINTCKRASCGDTFIGPGEYCDSNLNGEYHCDSECSGFMCSDDIIVAMEADLAPLEICSEMTGSLTFTGDEMTAITGLERLRTIKADLKIRESALTNLDGLASITTIGRTLDIQDNDDLLNLDGLHNLTVVNNILIKDNASLPTCEAEELRDLLGSENLSTETILQNTGVGDCE